VLKPWTRYCLYVATLPNDLVGWLVVLFVRVVWGSHLEWIDGSLTTRFAPGSWPVRTWYVKWGGTCIGHGILLNGAHSEASIARTLFHERIHVEQFEANCLAAFMLALVLLAWTWIAALLVWILLPWAIYGAGMLVA
jgi:hypothetical protein